MKIISSKKDYFDHLVGYYGYDDHIVWDRRNSEPLSFKWADEFLFYICGEIVPVIKKGKDFIFDSEDPRLNTGTKHRWSHNYDREWMRKWHKRKTTINEEFRQPILCSVHLQKYEYFIPCLADFGFAAKFEAHEMYQKIYAFLGWLKDNPEPPNNQTDKDKIVSHGFSTRDSFRPKMKD